MPKESPLFGRLLLAVALGAFSGAAGAQTPTVTLTITNNGVVSGAVGVQGPNGNVCNPSPGGSGGGTCVFTYNVNTPLRIAANSPNPDAGFLHSGTGDAAACAFSTCNIVLTTNSSITATFDASQGPVAQIETTLLGDGTGNVGTDNGQCQNFELGYSDCTTHYAVGSEVKLQGRSMPGNIFAGFSGGVGDTTVCGAGSTCTFTATGNSSVNAAFSALSSVAVSGPMSTPVNTNAFFTAQARFTNGMTRPGFNGVTPWQSHVAMDVARSSLAAAVVNDRLYAIGGVDGFCPSAGPGCPFAPLGTVEVFNPQVTAIAEFSQAWTPRQSMAAPRGGLAAVAAGGKIYALGGHTTGGDAVSSMEAYDPLTNAWTARASMAGPRSGMAAAAIGNTIYAAGGTDGTGADASIPRRLEAYDAGSDSWAMRAQMLTARTSPAAAAVDGVLYVIGGDGIGSVEAYDPLTDTWTMKAQMPGGGGPHAAAALNGLIYAVGGSPVTTKVYNPARNAWATLSPQSQLPSGQFALAVLDGRLFAAGGNLADNTAVRTLLANRPPEATWWSSNPSVARINSGNNGSVNALAVGSTTISARLVGVDSGAQSALLTVTAGGGNFPIFLGMPSDSFGGAFADVGQSNWGCGTFGQTSSGPWTVQVDYGQGGGFENTPYIANPAPDGQCVQAGQFPKGLFSFNHAYAAPGDYLITVKVTNTTTSASQTGTFHVHVQEPEPDDCVPIISSIAVVGTVPFNRVQVTVFDGATNDLLFEAELPLGFFDQAALPEGQYRVEFSVPDGYMITPSSFSFTGVCGAPVHLNATVQAIPAVPPTISVQLSPNVIWPPNNKLVPIGATVTASSPNGHATTVALVSITNNETGSADVEGAAIGTDDRAFAVRARRAGGGSGRTYTVTYLATDRVTGATATASATIVVPHDQGR